MKSDSLQSAPAASPALLLLEQEARALLERIAKVQPFALQETMVPAAAVPPATLAAIDLYLLKGREQLRELVWEFLQWLRSPAGHNAPPAFAQRRFTMLRMRFNAALSQVDIFADALTQRSEHGTGIWLGGLDCVAADALRIPGEFYELPPVICYLDRGHGAAIRRARTRLPGGGENPAAIIRVPRERMIGSGIASSLIHEVGHQAAALLDLVESIRPTLHQLARDRREEATAWNYWARCLSEILADFWSVARVGLTSTLGLMGVVALPRYFVFRLTLDDPHPVPWLRVKLSCEMGRALYPHPQWERARQIWEALYPSSHLEPDRRDLFALLERTMPELAAILARHRPKSLRGHSLQEVLHLNGRQPPQLARLFDRWRAAPLLMRRSPPSLVFAVIGQARAEGKINPETESRILTRMLTYWALRDVLHPAGISSTQTPDRFPSPAPNSSHLFEPTI